MRSRPSTEIGKDPRVIVTACSLLLILPALSLLYYIRVFGVNVIVLDEWDFVPLLQKMMGGTLSFSDLFAQHNEHRIPFARMVMLALGKLTQYNTVAEMFVSWVLICFAGLLIFYVYWMNLSHSSHTRLLLGFLPVSFLLFSLKQYESILFGFPCHIYLMTFGAVLAFALLEVSRKIDVWFVLCILGAILASFSFIVGLMVWPTGLLQILISERKRGLCKPVLWCFAGAIAFASYFGGYVKPSIHPALDYVLTNPLGAGAYFLTLIGAVFCFDLVIAVAFSLVIVVITVLVLTRGYRERLEKKWRMALQAIGYVLQTPNILPYSS